RVPSVTPAGGCASWAHAAFARNTRVGSMIGDLISLALWSAILLHQPAALWAERAGAAMVGAQPSKGVRKKLLEAATSALLKLGGIGRATPPSDITLRPAATA